MQYNDEGSCFFDKNFDAAFFFFLSPLAPWNILPAASTQATATIPQGKQEWGEDRGEGLRQPQARKAPPLPGPLLHPMEEREWLRPLGLFLPKIKVSYLYVCFLFFPPLLGERGVWPRPELGKTALIWPAFR